MSRAALLLLPLVVLAAFLARERAGASRRVPGERAPRASAAQTAHEPRPTWVVDDARGAYHMRRVELALAANRLPAFDRFLGHPEGREALDGPLYATLLAAYAERAAAGGGDRALDGVDERGLERALAHVSPLLAALATLAVFLAGGALARHGPRWRAGLAAALPYALAPAALAAGEAGHLDERVWLDLLLAVHALLVVRALRAGEALDRMQGALLAGLAAGLACASSPFGGLVALTGFAGFLAALLARDDLLAHRAARDGLMYGLAASAASLVVGVEGPWELGPRASGAAHALSGLLALGALPFLLGSLSPTRLLRRGLAWVALALGLAAAVLLVPDMLAGLATALAAPHEQRALFGEPSRAGTLALVAALALSCAVWVVGRKRADAPADAGGATDEQRPRPEQLVVWTGAAAWLVAALLDADRLPELALAVGLGAALAVDALARRPRAGASLLAASALAFGLPTAWRLAAPLASEPSRLALVRELRRMRDETPSAGAWNAAATRKDWGVLAPASLGTLIAYHARRPVIALGRAGGVDRAASVREAWASDDPAAFVARLRALGAAYVVVGPSFLAELGGDGASAAQALAQAGPGAAFGLERAWPAEAAAEPLSVYRVPAAAAQQPARLELRAR